MFESFKNTVHIIDLEKSEVLPNSELKLVGEYSSKVSGYLGSLQLKTGDDIIYVFYLNNENDLQI